MLRNAVKRTSKRLKGEITPEAQKNTTSLSEFKSNIYKRYNHADHLDLLDRYLVQVSRFTETGGKEGVGRLVIEMPP